MTAKPTKVQFNEEAFRREVELGATVHEALALQELTITSLYREPKVAPALSFLEPVEDHPFPVLDDGFVNELAGMPGRTDKQVKKNKRVELAPEMLMELDADLKKKLPGKRTGDERSFRLTKAHGVMASTLMFVGLLFFGWPSTPEAHASAQQRVVDAEEPAEKAEAPVKAAEPSCPTLDAELERVCPEQFKYAKDNCRKIHTSRNKTSCTLIFASTTEQEEYHLRHPETAPKVEDRKCDFVNQRDGKCIPSTRYNEAAAAQFAKAEQAREATTPAAAEKMDEFGNIIAKKQAVSIETMKKDREDAKNLHGLTLVNTKTMTGLSEKSLKRLLETDKSYICDELPMVMERRLRGQQQMRDAAREHYATDEEIVKIEQFMAITNDSIDELQKFSEVHCK